MKKLFLLIACSILLQSCATLFAGQTDECQRCMPKPGEQKRKLRWAPLTADIIFVPLFGAGVLGLTFDFANNSIYKPCSKQNNSVNKTNPGGPDIR